MHFLDQFHILLGETSLVAGDVNDGAIELFNFHIQLGHVDFELLNSLDWQQFLFVGTVQLSEQLVHLLLEFGLLFVSSEIQKFI